MQLGFIGSGNMARAIALGLGEPALVQRQRFWSRAELLAEADRWVEAPNAGARGAQRRRLPLPQAGAACRRGALNSVDSPERSSRCSRRRRLRRCARPIPNATVVRTMPNIPVEFGDGVFAIAAESDDVPGRRSTLFDRLGRGRAVPEAAVRDRDGDRRLRAGVLRAVRPRADRLPRSRAGWTPALAKTIVGQTLRGHRTDAQRQRCRRGRADDGRRLARRSDRARARQSFDESGLQDAVDRAVATVLGE